MIPIEASAWLLPIAELLLCAPIRLQNSLQQCQARLTKREVNGSLVVSIELRRPLILALRPDYLITPLSSAGESLKACRKSSLK